MFLLIAAVFLKYTHKSDILIITHAKKEKYGISAVFLSSSFTAGGRT